MASSSTFLARDVYGRSGPVVCPAFPFLTVSSIFCWMSSSSTLRFWSTVAATPSPSRISPSRICSVPTYSWCSRAASSRAICRTFRTRSVKLYPFIAVPASSGLRAQQATNTRRPRGALFSIAQRPALHRRQMSGLRMDEELVEGVYTEPGDQIQPDAQAHAAQQVHRLLERQRPRVAQQPVRPPHLVVHRSCSRLEEHVPCLLFVFNNLPHNAPEMIEQLPFSLAKCRLIGQLKEIAD